MAKRISLKRYLYDNGVLILKNKDNDTNYKLNEVLVGQNSRNVNINNNIDFPLLSHKIIKNNNNKIFTTEIKKENQKENKKEELKKNISYIEENKEEDNNKLQ